VCLLRAAHGALDPPRIGPQFAGGCIPFLGGLPSAQDRDPVDIGGSTDRSQTAHRQVGERAWVGQGARNQISAKKAAMSRARSSGSSAAAKCPPLGIEVHRRTSYSRSAHSRGGLPSDT